VIFLSVIYCEHYRQQNDADIIKVFCKPTKNFPIGTNYFYAPAEYEDYIMSKCWYLIKNSGFYVGRHVKSGFDTTLSYLHIEVKNLLNEDTFGYDVNHKNLCEFDDTFENLETIEHKLNQVCKMKQVYGIIDNAKAHYFTPSIRIDGELILGSSKHDELSVCLAQRDLELSKRSYNVDPLNYFRGSDDILDLLRTGKIDSEESKVMLLQKYARNVWYIARYNLFEECEKYHIDIAPYRLNVGGYLIDSSGNLLNPYKNKKASVFN
jgi:hypothetical protein